MKSRYWIMALTALVLVSGLACVPLLRQTEAQQAEIASGGQVIAVVDLSADREFVVGSPDGGRNTVTIRDGAIAVTAADCPDHYCMERGFCTGGSAIVCLPNRLVITFLGDQEIDAAAG